MDWMRSEWFDVGVNELGLKVNRLVLRVNGLDQE